MRRWELGIGPLLARLGYDRPDEDPLRSADGVFPAVLLGDWRTAARGPGNRFVWQSGQADAVAALFSLVIFTPPAGGAWLHAFEAQSDAASFVGWGTTNELAPVITAGTGDSEISLRPDNREERPTFGSVDTGAGDLVILNRVAGMLRTNPVWWEATQLFAQCTQPLEGITATVQIELPLIGQRRNP